jgi:hypothetical protein
VLNYPPTDRHLTARASYDRTQNMTTGARRETFDYDVFRSHSSKDKAVVRPVAEKLRPDGIRVS